MKRVGLGLVVALVLMTNVVAQEINVYKTNEDTLCFRNLAVLESAIPLISDKRMDAIAGLVSAGSVKPLAKGKLVLAVLERKDWRCVMGMIEDEFYSDSSVPWILPMGSLEFIRKVNLKNSKACGKIAPPHVWVLFRGLLNKWIRCHLAGA